MLVGKVVLPIVARSFLLFFGQVQPEKCGGESGRFAIKGGMVDSFSLLGSVPTLSRAQVAYEGIITGLEPHVGH